MFYIAHCSNHWCTAYHKIMCIFIINFIASIPGYSASSHLSKQSTVMRNKLQQSWVHQLETIWTWLHKLFYNHLKEGKDMRRYYGRVFSIVCTKHAEKPRVNCISTWSMYGLTRTWPTRASASRVLSMVAYVLRQWRTMSTLDVCRPSISKPSRDCCSMEVIPAIRWQRIEFLSG